MKVKLLLILSFCLISVKPLEVKGQKLDSIRYEYGHLYYHEYGQGKPIIVLSGGPGNSCSQIEEVAIQLSRKYRTILLEQRGTGRSMPTRMDSVTINLKALVNDLNILLDHLRLKEAIILGHSWGGMLALSFAAEHPSRVKSLILIGPGPYKDQPQALQRAQMHARTRLGQSELDRLSVLNEKITKQLASAADSLEQRKLTRTAFVYQRPISDTLFKKIDVTVYPLMRQLLRKELMNSYDLTGSLPKYEGRIDVICGRQDILADNTYELKIFKPAAQLHWIEQCGHFPMFERPQEFYGLLFSILNGI